MPLIQCSFLWYSMRTVFFSFHINEQMAIKTALSHCFVAFVYIEWLKRWASSLCFPFYLCILNVCFASSFGAEFIGLIGQFCNNNYGLQHWIFREFCAAANVHIVNTLLIRKIFLHSIFLFSSAFIHFMPNSPLSFACIQTVLFALVLWWFDHDHPQANRCTSCFLIENEISINSIKMLCTFFHINSNNIVY